MPDDIALRIARQLARPNGWSGELLGWMMDLLNRRPTRLAVDLLAPAAGERVLDAGCGTGAALAEVLRRAPCDVTGVDPSATMLRAARRRLGPGASLHGVEIENLPPAMAQFDAALALNVLYFCDPAGSMVNRLREALRPDGRFVAYVTHRDAMRGWTFANRGLHRLYDESGLQEVLLAGGFARARIEVHTVPIAGGVKGLLAYAQR